MDILDFIPASVFEAFGALVGLFACAVIAAQLVAEWKDKKPSSLSKLYVGGWFLIFLFWLLYGIRFRALAICLANSIAAMLQFALLMVVLRKRKMD